MTRCGAALGIAVPILLLGAASCALAEEAISVSTLIREGKKYDGKEVTVVGEVVGDVMKREKYCWVNVLGMDDVAIGVCANEAQVRAITCRGDYFHHGDDVRISGIMYRFAPKLGGETCIVAEEVTRVKSGCRISHATPQGKVAIGVFLTLCSLMSFIMYKKYYPPQDATRESGSPHRS